MSNKEDESFKDRMNAQAWERVWWFCNKLNLEDIRADRKTMLCLLTQKCLTYDRADVGGMLSIVHSMLPASKHEFVFRDPRSGEPVKIDYFVARRSPYFRAMSYSRNDGGL